MSSIDPAETSGTIRARLSESRWKSVAAALTAVAGIMSAVGGIATVVNSNRTLEPAEPRDVQELRRSIHELRQQLKEQRAQVPARSALAADPEARRNWRDLKTQIGQWNQAADAPNPDVERYLRDSSLSDPEKVALALGSGIDGFQQHIDSLPSPSSDGEALQSKQSAGRHNQELDDLKQIMARYNDQARGIIESMR
jgi:hypothetical protein